MSIATEKIADLIQTNSLLNIQISQADPLGVDNFMRILPVLNTGNEVSRMLDKTQKIVELNLNTQFNRIEALASLRDLGMICASIKKNGIEPTSGINHLDDFLEQLGNLGDNAPRDTVYSYGPWNPIGKRRRKFTEIEEEEKFISSFTTGMLSLDNTIYHMAIALNTPIESTDFSDNIDMATVNFSSLVDAIVQVRREISPELFTYQLRPYFDPYYVKNLSYLAPGGAQMPLLLIDQLAWGADSENNDYKNYFAENMLYVPKEYQQISEELKNTETLLSKIHSEKSHTLTTNQKSSLRAVERFFAKLISFRMPHLRIAKDNFALRGSNDVGSGGYTTVVLEDLIQRSEEAKKSIRSTLNE